MVIILTAATIVLTVAVAGKSCTLSFLLFYYNEYVGPFGVGTILECLKYCWVFFVDGNTG